MKDIDKMINDFTKEYIIPLKLEDFEYSHFIKNELSSISYNIAEALLSNTNYEIYRTIYKEMEDYLESNNPTESMVISEFVEIVVKQWISVMTEKLYDSCSFIFEETIYPSDEDIDKAVLDYLLKIKDSKIELVNKEEMLSDIESKIINDYYWSGDDTCNNNDYYLTAINYTDLIDAIYGLGLEYDISDCLDSFVNDLYAMHKLYKINSLGSTEVFLNIFPKQDGNDEGDKLGGFLDYTGLHVGSDIIDSYYSYYIHHSKPATPKCLEWLFETQGYKVEDLYNKEKIESSPFLNSVIQELLCEENSLQFLTFAIKTTIEDLYLFINKKEFTMLKETTCGFANIVHGSIGGLDIKLEKDIKLSFDIQKEIFQVEGANEDSSYGYGYMLSDIFGFDSCMYTKINY